MVEEENILSWILKPCSDGVSIDVRPPTRFQIQLLSLKNQLPEKFTSQVITPALAILYDQNNIKVTLYQSGRMLLETRDMSIAKGITKKLLDFFNFK